MYFQSQFNYYYKDAYLVTHSHAFTEIERCGMSSSILFINTIAIFAIQFMIEIKVRIDNKTQIAVADIAKDLSSSFTSIQTLGYFEINCTF